MRPAVPPRLPALPSPTAGRTPDLLLPTCKEEPFGAGQIAVWVVGGENPGQLPHLHKVAGMAVERYLNTSDGTHCGSQALEAICYLAQPPSCAYTFPFPP